MSEPGPLANTRVGDRVYPPGVKINGAGGDRSFKIFGIFGWSGAYYRYFIGLAGGAGLDDVVDAHRRTAYIPSGNDVGDPGGGVVRGGGLSSASTEIP